MPSKSLRAVDQKKILANAQLPALPQSAVRLLELSQDPGIAPGRFAVPIESDPGLAGQVLRFVNSSYFGFSREISSIKLAITLVGMRTIKNFALWSAVFSLMPNPKCGPFDLRKLWQDSLRRALFARHIGRMLGMKEAEEPFSAALLQDMAVPLLAKESPETYVQLLENRDNGRVRLSDLEREHMGWTHAEAGGAMARQWNLPDGFAILIENHLEVDHWLENPRKDAAYLAVSLSALLPTASDPEWVDHARFESIYEKIRTPDAPHTADLFAKLDQDFTDLAPILRLANPTKSLAAIYSETTAAEAAASAAP